jgi:hypothetical protein
MLSQCRKIVFHNQHGVINTKFLMLICHYISTSNFWNIWNILQTQKRTSVSLMKLWIISVLIRSVAVKCWSYYAQCNVREYTEVTILNISIVSTQNSTFQTFNQHGETRQQARLYEFVHLTQNLVLSDIADTVLQRAWCMPQINKRHVTNCRCIRRFLV